MVKRDKQCSYNYGGSSELYIFEYVKYSRSKIKVVDNILIDFPTSAIFNLNPININFTESVDVEDGGVTFSQSGSFQLNKILKTDSFKKLFEKDWRIIIKDNNGNYRFIGLKTGLKIKYTKELGGSLGDFNGFKMSFETKEEETAPFLTDLSNYDINGVIASKEGLQQELQYEL